MAGDKVHPQRLQIAIRGLIYVRLLGWVLLRVKTMMDTRAVFWDVHW